jgi:hypothetical protein
MNAEGEEDGEDRDGDGESVDGVRAAEQGVGDATDRGSGDGCDLKGAGIPGDGVGEMLFGNEVGENGAADGKAETAEDSEEDENEVDGVYGVGSAPTDGEEQGRAEAVAGIAPHKEFAAVEDIGGVTGEEKEDEAREKLGEADVSEIEGTFGDLIDLPSDGDGLHFERDHDEEAGEGKGDEVGVGEGNSPGEARVCGGEHWILLCHKIRGG